MTNGIQPVTPAQIERITTVKEAARIKKTADAAAVFYKAQEDLYASQQAKEISLRSARRAGQILSKVEREPGKRNDATSFSEKRGSTPYQEALDGTGITPFVANTWQKISEIPDKLFEQYIADLKYARTEFTIKGLLKFATNIHVSDDSYEWYTPPEFIVSANDVMGQIDLDPASSERANEVVKAGKIYTAADDGLVQEWAGNVWLNPPYSMPHILWFVRKLIQDYEAGNIQQAIILVNNSTDTAWFHMLAERYIYCMVKGRVQFWKDDEKPQARQGQFLFYLGNNKNVFSKEYSKYGLIGCKYDY